MAAATGDPVQIKMLHSVLGQEGGVAVLELVAHLGLAAIDEGPLSWARAGARTYWRRQLAVTEWVGRSPTASGPKAEVNAWIAAELGRRSARTSRKEVSGSSAQ
jgi:hypothetical protein